MADRYWVGGTGTWNTTSTTNWASSSGGAGGASVPTATDNVFFDQASTYTVTMTGALLCLNLTVSAGTVTFATGTSPTLAVSGNFSIFSSTIWSSTGTVTFTSAIASTKTIVTNGVTLNCSITFSGSTSAWQLLGATTIASTRTVTLTSGTLNLNNYTLTAGRFSSSNTNSRTIAFGTSGVITLNGTGTVWTTSSSTNFNRTGTGRTVNVANNTSTATTITTGVIPEIRTLDFNITTGTYALQDSGSYYHNLNLSGFSGTLNTGTRSIYGDFNTGTTVALTAGILATTFSTTTTSGTANITTNGKTIDFPLIFNGVGGIFRLQDALTMGTSRTFTLTNGTFDANNYNVTVGTLSSSNSNTRTLALGSGTWTVAGTGTSAWDFSTATNATITGTATISMIGATAKTFVGGSKTWPTLNQGGAGALTISGNNTFTNITSTYISTSACEIIFSTASTTTVNNFSASGQAGKILSISSSTPGTQAILSKSAGTISVNYCSIKDSNATGGAVWEAFYSNGNINGGNNAGWDFGIVANSYNFFAFF